MDAAMIEMVSGSSNRARRPNIRGLQAKSARQHMSDMKSTVRVLRRLLTGLADNTLVGVNKRIGIHEVFCIQNGSRLIIALTSGHNIPNGRSEIMGVDIGPLSIASMPLTGPWLISFFLSMLLWTLRGGTTFSWSPSLTTMSAPLKLPTSRSGSGLLPGWWIPWRKRGKTRLTNLLTNWILSGSKLQGPVANILNATNKGCEIIASAMRADFDKMTPLARGLVS